MMSWSDYWLKTTDINVKHFHAVEDISEVKEYGELKDVDGEVKEYGEVKDVDSEVKEYGEVKDVDGEVKDVCKKNNKVKSVVLKASEGVKHENSGASPDIVWSLHEENHDDVDDTTTMLDIKKQFYNALLNHVDVFINRRKKHEIVTEIENLLRCNPRIWLDHSPQNLGFPSEGVSISQYGTFQSLLVFDRNRRRNKKKSND